MKDFTDRVAVVTGAGSGIGRAVAVDLARRGARLALSDVDSAGLTETERRCEATGAQVRSYALDVSDRDAVHAHADRVADDFGQVNLVLNNAGVAVAAPVVRTSREDFDWIMGVNFWGVVHGSQAFLPHLLRSGEGHIVNLSSIFGILSMPAHSAYNASKFAVRGFTEALRMELLAAGAPVGVTCVHPGGIATGIARTARVVGADAQRTATLFDTIAPTTPEKAAAVILRGVRRDRSRVFIGADARAMELTARVLGGAYMRVIAPRAGRSLAKGGFSREGWLPETDSTGAAAR